MFIPVLANAWILVAAGIAGLAVGAAGALIYKQRSKSHQNEERKPRKPTPGRGG